MSDALVSGSQLTREAMSIAAPSGAARRWELARERQAAWDACRSWRDLFTEVLGPRARRVLEVECGDGDATLLLYVLGHQAHGADSSADRVRRLQARADAACAAADFRVSEAEDLKFPAGVFDAVHARGLFASAARPGDVLLEWYRVLRTGGTALVIERDGGARPGDLLRTAGFSGVREREARLPRRCLPRLTRDPWYRRLLATTAKFRVAWGTRP
jgi:ubiquinone/menaquinone biosynthesis C-methylase UbiE